VPKYIILGNWTDEGRKTLDTDYPKRIERSQKIVEEYSGSMNLCFTMGEYDFVAIVDMPDEENMVKMLIKLNERNRFTTKTLKAWTDTEFTRMINEM